MKRMIYVGAIAILAGCSSSSSESENGLSSTTLKAEDTEVYGGTDFLIEGEAKANLTEGYAAPTLTIKVKLKSEEEDNPENYPGIGDGDNGPLYMSILDKDGVPIDGWQDIPSVYSDDEKLANLMGNPGETKWVTFEQIMNADIKGIPSNASKFEIWYKKKSISSGGSNDDYIPENSEEWDEFLDEYEEFVDEYIEVLEEANNGDGLSAASESIEVFEKASSLGKRIENAKSDLSVEQASRFTKLQLKLANAASKLVQ